MQAEGGVIPFPDRASAPTDFSVFIAEEHRRVFKALYFVTGNRADAAELMQDAFLKRSGSAGTRSTGSTTQPPTCSAWR
jgi:DNA-directed RNA polymerase specialized sigma24 family protein